MSKHKSSIKSHRALAKKLNYKNGTIFAVIGILAITGAVLVYKSFAASGTLTLTPSSSTVNIGSNFTITVHANGGTDPLSGAEADLTYDPAKLQFVSATNTGTNFDAVVPPTNSSGLVQIGAAHKGTTGLSGDQIVGTVTFTALAPGTATVAFANTSDLLPTSNPATNVLTASPSGTYTIADTQPPNAPTGLTAGTKTVNSIALIWVAPSDNVGVTGYKVYRNGSTTPVTTIGTNTPNYTDTGLTPNTSYSYTVQALDAAGNPSALSTALAASTLPDTTAPPVPTGLTAGTKTVTSINISWAASIDNVLTTGYKVLRNGTVVNANVSSTNYTDTGLTPNTSYSYTIEAFDAVPNVSLPSTALAVTTLADTTAPSVPTGLAAGTKTVNSITLTWAVPSDNVGVTSYEIFRNGSTTALATVTTNSFTDTGLTQNTSYSYTVQAFDAANNASAVSSAFVVTTAVKQGDINSDGFVNGADLSILAANYNKAGTYSFAQGDLDNNHVVNIIDLTLLAIAWGS